MYSYTICNQPDSKLFEKQCHALEKHIPDLIKGDLLEDVDGSQIQVYAKDGAKILVHNSEYVGALYIESEIEFKQFFKE